MIDNTKSLSVMGIIAITFFLFNATIAIALPGYEKKIRREARAVADINTQSEASLKSKYTEDDSKEKLQIVKVNDKKSDIDAEQRSEIKKNKSKERKIKKRQMRRAKFKERMKNMSPEERKAFREKRKEKFKERMKDMTPEQRKVFVRKHKEKMEKRRGSMSPERREKIKMDAK